MSDHHDHHDILVDDPNAFVVAAWNGMPADNTGKRVVMYLTDRVNAMGTAIFTSRRSEAKQFRFRARAAAAIRSLILPHLQELAKVYPNHQVHTMTGGIDGMELT